MSPLTKQVLIGLLGLYVAQLLFENWLGVSLIGLLAWWPVATGSFQPWQPFTCYLVNGPTPVSVLFDLLMVFFFLAPIEQSLGRKGLFRVTLFTIGLSSILGFLLNLAGAIGGTQPFLGLNPLVTMLIVLFGLTRPDAQILLFFVIPVRAVWMAWGTGLVSFLYFLANRDLESTLWLTGFVAAWLYLEGNKPQGRIRKLFLRRKHEKTRERLRKFDVIEGGRQEESPPNAGKSWLGRGSSDDDPIVH